MKPLKRIYIEITNICNLSCSFCPTSKRPKEVMTVAEFHHVIKQAAFYTNHIYLHVKGEPLLHPELDLILRLCNEYNLKVNITTNGTMLRKRMETLLHSPAVRQLNISLHSFESREDQIASLQTYMDDIISVSRELQANSNIIVALRLWNLDRDNYTESLKEQNHYVLKALEDEFSLSKPIAEQFLPDTHGVDGIDRAIPRGIKLADRIYLNQSYEFVWPDLNAPFVGDTGYCHGLKDQIAILSDGTVVPCCLDGEGIIALGNIHETSLTDILSNKRVESFKKGFANRTVIEQLCKHCGYRERFGN